MKTPVELDKIADVILRYQPAPKTKAAKRRERKAKATTTLLSDSGGLHIF